MEQFIRILAKLSRFIFMKITAMLFRIMKMSFTDADSIEWIWVNCWFTFEIRVTALFVLGCAIKCSDSVCLFIVSINLLPTSSYFSHSTAVIAQSAEPFWTVIRMYLTSSFC